MAEDGSDQPLLYTKQFNFPDGKAKFFPFEWSEPTDQPDASYDLHLNNGRLLEHFHEGNMTYRTEGIREKMPCTFVEVSPELARDRGIEDGNWVELTSRYGKVRVQALVTERVKGKELYMPMNSVDEPVNRLTSSYTDKVTHTPAYKETSVRMKVVGRDGESPLPRTTRDLVIRRCRAEWKSSGSGSVPITESGEWAGTDSNEAEQKLQRQARERRMNGQTDCSRNPATRSAQGIDRAPGKRSVRARRSAAGCIRAAAGVARPRACLKPCAAR